MRIGLGLETPSPNTCTYPPFCLASLWVLPKNAFALDGGIQKCVGERNNMSFRAGELQ